MPTKPEKFSYPTDHGEIVLPFMKDVPAGVIRKVRRLEGMDQTFSMLEELLDEEGLSVLDQLTTGDLDDLSSKWMESSEISLGESSGSSS